MSLEGKKHGDPEGLERYFQEVRQAQENILWPEALKNNRKVDELLWKGNTNAPTIQRIGLIVIALSFAFIAMAFIE